ncbi:hypothetical protein [Streptomyces sp. Tue6028]|nr:hypothetical protein [Streptomyces sp. Tue6028]
MLGHQHLRSSAKAERLLGRRARPTAETDVACAQDLIARGQFGCDRPPHG